MILIWWSLYFMIFITWSLFLYRSYHNRRWYRNALLRWLKRTVGLFVWSISIIWWSQEDTLNWSLSTLKTEYVKDPSYHHLFFFIISSYQFHDQIVWIQLTGACDGYVNYNLFSIVVQHLSTSSSFSSSSFSSSLNPSIHWQMSQLFCDCQRSYRVLADLFLRRGTSL